MGTATPASTNIRHDGELIKSWGQPGTGPSEFDLPHCVRVDPRNRLMVADRENNRIQFFTLDGEYIEEWGDLLHPDTIYIGEDDLCSYIAELDQRITIMTLDGEVVSQWGSERGSSVPGEFMACPHGIWLDSHGDIYVWGSSSRRTAPKIYSATIRVVFTSYVGRGPRASPIIHTDRASWQKISRFSRK